MKPSIDSNDKPKRSVKRKIRRSVSGIKKSPEQREQALARKFGQSYNAWCERRGLAKWDSSPNLRREVQ